MATRHFSIHTMLRMTPNRLLKEFFEQMGHPLRFVPWPWLPKRGINPILHGMKGLPTDDYDAIEAELRRIFDLADPTGSVAIAEAGTTVGKALIEEWSPKTDSYEKAMWTWLRHKDVFDVATLFHQVRNLRYWKKRKGLPQVEPRTSEAAIKNLASGISQLLSSEQGRGRRCIVEHYRRSETTAYFIAYPDDFIQTVVTYDDEGELTPQSFHKTFEIVFAYCAEEGTLELYAQVPSRLKPRLEELFCREILTETPQEAASGAVYDLSPLKQLRLPLDTEPEDCVTASVHRLRLALHNSHRRIILETDAEADGVEIYEMRDHYLNQEQVRLSDVDITSAKFRFVFRPLKKRPAGSIMVDVSCPDSCSLRNEPPERAEIVLKHLKRWGIAVG